MATKSTDETLAKVGDDEPIFVLRAQDRLAPDVVRNWARSAMLAGVPDEKVQEARRLATEMKQWQVRNRSKIPD